MQETLEESQQNFEGEGAEETLGVVDEPLGRGHTDRLKIKKHANALVQFVKSSQTPITIGIQGEWGSGKTSLLNTIYNELEIANKSPHSKDFYMIWVNTWENALMSTPEEALIKIINEIINELIHSDDKISSVESVKTAATTALKGMLRVGASVVGGSAGADVMGEVLESKNSVKTLRETLEKLVREIRESSNQRYDKVVIFVDDLDRIDPPEAVKILELLKNIFSIPGCVFILAIDYQVVIKGLKAKFGERTPENEWEFRAFFDKIIQLPFLMPMASYNIGNYVNHLLKKIGFQDENEIDEDFIERVVNYTIRGNPRSIKRLINSLALIKIFNDEVEDEENEDDKEEVTIDVQTERKILFALVCLQVSSPEIYSLLAHEPDFLKWDEALAFSNTQKKEEQDKQFKQNFEAVIMQDEFDEIWEQVLYRICYANPRERAKATELSKFFNFLKEDIGDDIELVQAIAEALGQSSVTSVVSTDEVIPARPKVGSHKAHFFSTVDVYLEELQKDGKDKKALSITKQIHDMLVTEFGIEGAEVIDGGEKRKWDKGSETLQISYAKSGATIAYKGKKIATFGPMWGKQGQCGCISLRKKYPEFQLLQKGNLTAKHQRQVEIMDAETGKRVKFKQNHNGVEYMLLVIEEYNKQDFEDLKLMVEDGLEATQLDIEHKPQFAIQVKKKLDVIRKSGIHTDKYQKAIDWVKAYYENPTYREPSVIKKIN